MDTQATAGQLKRAGMDAEATAGQLKRAGMDAEAAAGQLKRTGMDAEATVGQLKIAGMDAEATVGQSKITGMDAETTMGQLKRAVAAFVDARDWAVYHTPKNLAMSIAIEAAEILEHFQWLTPAESASLVADPVARAAVADELADVLIYCLSFANQCQIDISEAIQNKLTRNETRFPIDQVRGRL